MDIDILKLVLEQQLENNSIRRGTKRAHDFEYAFIVGALATYAARDEQPPVFLTVLAMSGRSIFELQESTNAIN